METEKYSLPNVGKPFVSVSRISSLAAQPDANRPHFHPDTIEVCAVIRGQLDWFVGDETYVVRPGEVVVVPPKQVHGAIDANLQPCEIVAVHFAPEQLPECLNLFYKDLTWTRIRHAEISARTFDVFEAHRNRNRFFRESVGALGTLLAAEIAAFEPNDVELEESRLIRLAQRRLLGKEGIRPTIHTVASRLGVSAVWLHKLFVRETGASPGDWARAKRIAEAKHRLAQGEETNVEIALDLGYSSGQAFATAFRKESGMTPSEYRELYTEGSQAAPRRIYRVDMRETWVNGVMIHPS